MDILTFIAKLVESLVWPIATITVVFMMKDKLSNLMLNIKRFKHKDTEIDFQQAVREVSSEMEKDGSLVEDKSPDDLSVFSPRGSIIESWLRIEDSLRKFNERHRLDSTVKKPFRSSDNKLQILDYDVLGKDTIVTLDKLRRLRNEAVHLNDANITTDSAIEYKNMASKVISAIEMA